MRLTISHITSRILLFILFIIGSEQFLSAQQINWSQSSKLNKKASSMKILGKNDQGFLIHFYGYKEHYLAQYSSGLQQKWIKQIIVGDKNIDVDEIILPVNNVLVFYNVLNDNNQRSFYAKTLKDDLSEGKIISLKEHVKNRKDRNEHAQVKLSKNRSKILWTLKENANDLNNSVNISCRVVDNKLNFLYRTTILIPFKKSMFLIEDYLVDNDGNLFFLITVRDTELKRSDPDRLKHHLYVYDRSSQSLSKFRLKIKSKYISSIKMAIDNLNHHISIGGFYSEHSFYSINGTFFMTFNLENRIIEHQGHHALESSFLKQILEERIKAQNNELNDFLLRNLVLRDDGGMILIAESYYTTVVSYNSPNLYNNTYTASDLTYYHYNDIIVFSINPDGSIDWNKVIKKRQISREFKSNYTSFKLSINKDKMYFIFNDDISRNNNLIQFSISNKGDVKIKSLFKDVMATRLAKQLSDNEIIIPNFDRNNLRLAKLEYN